MKNKKPLPIDKFKEIVTGMGFSMVLKSMRFRINHKDDARFIFKKLIGPKIIFYIMYNIPKNGDIVISMYYEYYDEYLPEDKSDTKLSNMDDPFKIIPHIQHYMDDTAVELFITEDVDKFNGFSEYYHRVVVDRIKRMNGITMDKILYLRGYFEDIEDYETCAYIQETIEMNEISIATI